MAGRTSQMTDLASPPLPLAQGVHNAHSHETELFSMLLAIKHGLSVVPGNQNHFSAKLDRLEQRGDPWIVQVSRYLRSLLDGQFLEVPFKRASIPGPWSREPWYDNTCASNYVR